jgi:transposase-like protein
MLYAWIKRWRDSGGETGGHVNGKRGAVFPGQGKLTPQDEEIRRLRRELAIVTEEREILKKATAFFAKMSK